MSRDEESLFGRRRGGEVDGQQQEQQLVLGHQHIEALEESYLDAQRAGVEAIEIGRATLTQSHQQGEQLRRAESIADDTQYSLDKADRLLRGMSSWAGWFANKFTPDVTATKRVTTNENVNQRRSTQPKAIIPKLPPLSYDMNRLLSQQGSSSRAQSTCRDVVQAMQNYHVNVRVLMACETNEQRETCRSVCDSVYNDARTKLDRLKNLEQQQQQRQQDNNGDSSSTDEGIRQLIKEFDRDLTLLRSIQKKLLQQQQQPPPLSANHSGGGVSNTASNSSSQPQSKLSTNAVTAAASSTATTSVNLPPELMKHQQRQDEHLHVLSQNLDELGNIANTMTESIQNQNSTLDRLHDKSDNIYEQTKRVTRRADRLTQTKSWSTPPPVYVGRYLIRHVESDRYLAVVNTDLYLVPKRDNIASRKACIFTKWKRAAPGSSLFGLKSKMSDKWIGQNLFGSIVCSASSMGRREEFEVDKGWDTPGKTTPILCASAGWGYGAYLTVRRSDHAILIGSTTGTGIQAKQAAALWCFEEAPEV